MTGSGQAYHSDQQQERESAMSAHSSTALPAPASSLSPGEANPSSRPELLPSDTGRAQALDKQCYSCLLWQRMRQLMVHERQPAHNLPSAQPAVVAAVAAGSGASDVFEQSAPAQPPEQVDKLQHVTLHQQQWQQQQQFQAGDVQKPAAADCLGCRLTGLALGVGGSVYVGSRLLQEPYPKGMHRYSLIGVSAGLLALGVGRALGF